MIISLHLISRHSIVDSIESPISLQEPECQNESIDTTVYEKAHFLRIFSLDKIVQDFKCAMPKNKGFTVQCYLADTQVYG